IHNANDICHYNVDTQSHPNDGIPITSLVKTNHFIHLDVQFKNKHAMMLPVKHKKSPFGIKVISPLYLRGDETRRSSRFMLIDSKESRSEEHTSELQSRFDLVCRLLL